jgi:hypothetical protein
VLGAKPRRHSGDGIFEQAIEKHASLAGVAVVEAESEFIEVGIQMLCSNRSLVRTQKASV